MTKAPVRWREAYELIKEMRAAKPAPVDTMGCMRLHDFTAPPAVQRFQILVALFLSSQTRDGVTAQAMKQLHTLPLTIPKLIETPLDQLTQLIYPVSFYRTKARRLQELALVLRDQYQGDIPRALEQLKKLPGIGPKMAYLAMQFAWHQNVGIGVDVHVHRIVGRLGWVEHSKSPEETRKALEEWLPSEYWTEINPLLVGFGQTICLPMRPLCSQCKLKDICPSACPIPTPTPAITSASASSSNRKRHKTDAPQD